jgi:hypothetical protein
VREAERIARRIATDKARKKELLPTPELMEIEKHLQEKLGTRVHIQQGEVGGKITIDYFSNDDLDVIVDVLGKAQARGTTEENFKAFIATKEGTPVSENISSEPVLEERAEKEEVALLDDRNKEEVKESEEDVDSLYNIKNFSL